MKTTISKSENFYREVRLEPIDALPGNSTLQIYSALLSAKDPTDLHKNFEAIVNQQDIEALRDLLTSTLEIK